MKKKNILPCLITLTLGALVVTGCDINTPTSESESVNTTESLDVEDQNQTYHFFIDYGHTDEDYYTLKWWQNTPLGSCPEECQLTSEDAMDPLFPVFLGWSLYPSSVDDSNLWNFETDYRTAVTVNLYGIWVSAD